MDERQLLRHVLILGTTGSGKTNHAFHLITEVMGLAEDATCIIIDTKQEYKALSEKLDVERFVVGGETRDRLNPLAPPAEVKADHWDRAFADVFTRAYGLSEPSRRIILDSLFRLRQGAKEDPTLRELEEEVARFDPGSSKEQNSKRSLESRLHIINTGPLGESLNTQRSIDVGSLGGKVVVFEIGDVDSLRDQRFVAELLMLYFWQHDRAQPWAAEERLRRLVVVEEAHRYLSEERPPEQRGERTLLELAIAEARRYGWGFIIIDQMPMLLSRYVWDNVGTTFIHRLANLDSYRAASRAFGEDPTSMDSWNDERMMRLVLKLPEDLALYKRYVDYGSGGGPATGVASIPKFK